jgi:hypothetical protein
MKTLFPIKSAMTAKIKADLLTSDSFLRMLAGKAAGHAQPCRLQPPLAMFVKVNDRL